MLPLLCYRFSTFVKSGGEAFLLGTNQDATVQTQDKVVIEVGINGAKILMNLKASKNCSMEGFGLMCCSSRETCCNAILMIFRCRSEISTSGLTDKTTLSSNWSWYPR